MYLVVAGTHRDAGGSAGRGRMAGRAADVGSHPVGVITTVICAINRRYLVAKGTGVGRRSVVESTGRVGARRMTGQAGAGSHRGPNS